MIEFVICLFTAAIMVFLVMPFIAWVLLFAIVATMGVILFRLVTGRPVCQQDTHKDGF